MEKIIAIVAGLFMVGFLGILFWFVPRVDLGVLIVITIAMMAYDFYRTFQGNSG